MHNHVVLEHDYATSGTRAIGPMSREGAEAVVEQLAIANTDATRSYTIGYATITRAMVDYLPVAVRAAGHRPESAHLWVESFLAQQAVMATANRIMPEDAAAEVQVLAGRIADLATQPATARVAAASQNAKAAIMHLVNLV